MTKTVYRNRRGAANYLTEERGLKTSPTTLAKLASIGGGPVYSLYGRDAVYTDSDLDMWADGKLSAPRRSTSEAA